MWRDIAVMRLPGGKFLRLLAREDQTSIRAGMLGSPEIMLWRQVLNRGDLWNLPQLGRRILHLSPSHHRLVDQIRSDPLIMETERTIAVLPHCLLPHRLPTHLQPGYLDPRHTGDVPLLLAAPETLIILQCRHLYPLPGSRQSELFPQGARAHRILRALLRRRMLLSTGQRTFPHAHLVPLLHKQARLFPRDTTDLNEKI